MGSGKDGWKPAGLHSELPQRGVSPRGPVQAGPKGRDCGGAVPLRVEKTKANRPVSRILYPAEAGRRSFLWAAELLPGSSDLPESYPRPLPGGVGWSEPLLLSYLVLLHVGFTLPRPSPSGRCALTLSSRRNRTISPLPRLATGRYIFCGTFRTCLTPRAGAKEARQILAVSQHTALRSPDFPPRPQGTERSPGLLAQS